MTQPNDPNLDPLASLTHLTPAADATTLAIVRARAALSKEQTTHRARRRRRIIVTTALASVLSLGTLAALTLLTPTRLDAAAQLAQIAEANQAYQGWVHMTSESPGEKPGDAPRIGRTHLNTADGTVIFDRQRGDWRSVRMIVPAANELRTYDSTTNEIVVENVGPDAPADLTEHLRNFPLTVAAVEADRKQRGLPPARIEHHTEGNLDRFDVTAPPSPHPATRSAVRIDFERATVWSDPRTKLITKFDIKLVNKPSFTVTATYGDPAIASLYDLGIPRDAKVVDKRHP